MTYVVLAFASNTPKTYQNIQGWGTKLGTVSEADFREPGHVRTPRGSTLGRVVRAGARAHTLLKNWFGLVWGGNLCYRLFSPTMGK